MKILSIDDSAIIRRIISGIVESLGYDFIEAENGKQGLDIVEAQGDDIMLILLDWNMPVLDGYSTLVALKKHPKYQHIPVMMVTTESERNKVIRAISAGAQHYVTKPFTHEDLTARIMECAGMGCC